MRAVVHLSIVHLLVPVFNYYYYYYYLFVTCNWVVTRWQESVTLVHVIQFHGLQGEKLTNTHY